MSVFHSNEKHGTLTNSGIVCRVAQSNGLFCCCVFDLNKNNCGNNAKGEKNYEFNFFSVCFCISSDDHGFSPLHWLAKEGHTKLVEMLLQRGARVNATNMGDDIPLHLAVAHGHMDIVLLVRLIDYYHCFRGHIQN